MEWKIRDPIGAHCLTACRLAEGTKILIRCVPLWRNGSRGEFKPHYRKVSRFESERGHQSLVSPSGVTAATWSSEGHIRNDVRVQVSPRGPKCVRAWRNGSRAALRWQWMSLKDSVEVQILSPAPKMYPGVT